MRIKRVVGRLHAGDKLLLVLECGHQVTRRRDGRSRSQQVAMCRECRRYQDAEIDREVLETLRDPDYLEQCRQVAIALREYQNRWAIALRYTPAESEAAGQWEADMVAGAMEEARVRRLLAVVHAETQLARVREINRKPAARESGSAQIRRIK